MKIYESHIEEFAIELLKEQGYEHIYAPNLEREFSEILLKDRLKNALFRLNPNLSPQNIDETIKEIERASKGELISDNENFHKLLVNGAYNC